MSRKSRDLRRAQAHRRAGSLSFAPARRDEKAYNSLAKLPRPWQACMGQVSNRLVPGDVSTLHQDPATPKDRGYAHGPLAQPTHLWADTVHAGDSDIRRGRLYQTKKA